MKKLLFVLQISLLQAEEDCVKDLNILYDKEMDKQADLLHIKVSGIGNDFYFLR
jgi:hypothetical protein